MWLLLFTLQEHISRHMPRLGSAGQADGPVLTRRPPHLHMRGAKSSSSGPEGPEEASEKHGCAEVVRPWRPAAVCLRTARRLRRGNQSKGRLTNGSTWSERHQRPEGVGEGLLQGG